MLEGMCGLCILLSSNSHSKRIGLAQNLREDGELTNSRSSIPSPDSALQTLTPLRWLLLSSALHKVSYRTANEVRCMMSYASEIHIFLQGCSMLERISEFYWSPWQQQPRQRVQAHHRGIRSLRVPLCHTHNPTL